MLGKVAVPMTTPCPAWRQELGIFARVLADGGFSNT
jgi:hypothetical protein